jgi:hypothetical protein
VTYVLPIPLPQSLVDERRLVAKNDFAHTHHTVAFGPDGRGYVHSEIFYNYLRYKQGDGASSARSRRANSKSCGTSGAIG